jgi:hypothetical protein
VTAATATRRWVSVRTRAGAWRLGWDPEQATFSAAHHRDPQGRADVELGTGAAAYPSVGALEEALGWPLPAPLRDALAAEQRRLPALAVPRGGAIPDPDRPRGADTHPTWDSAARVEPDGTPAPWGLLVERERPLADVELGDGTRLEILSSEPDLATGGLRVGYRLSHHGRVIFAGDDITAPPGADLAGDAATGALLGVLLDPDPTHRARPFTHPQAAFAAAHAQRALAAAEPPAHPWPAGTRVATTAGARHTGTVDHAVSGRDGQVLGYAWRPDTAVLVGHPWRYQPDHTLVSPPGQLAATLTGPDRGIPAAGTPLVFGAVVACPDPATGERVEATVLRAFNGRDGLIYQVQPNTPEATPAFTVAEDRCATVAGTWWATPAALYSARQHAGLDVVAGEVFAAGTGAVGVVGDATAPSPLTAAQQHAALTVDVDEPAPSLVKVSTHGQLTRVGDPDHGWIVVATDRWLAAMCRPGEELRAILAERAPGVLAGGEPRPTLAALAARHAPDTLQAPPARLAERFAAPAPLANSGVGL